MQHTKEIVLSYNGAHIQAIRWGRITSGRHLLITYLTQVIVT